MKKCLLALTVLSVCLITSFSSAHARDVVGADLIAPDSASYQKAPSLTCSDIVAAMVSVQNDINAVNAKFPVAGAVGNLGPDARASYEQALADYQKALDLLKIQFVTSGCVPIIF